jgi:hypothetical protein
VLIYPELSPKLRLFLIASPASVGFGFIEAGGSRVARGFIEPVDGSVSVSLSPNGLFSSSGDLSFCVVSSGASAALAEPSSATNQFMDHHNPPHSSDKTMKWTLYVASRRQSRRNCRQANDAFVATRSVDEGPGIKMLFQSSSKKDAISRSPERDTGESQECQDERRRRLGESKGKSTEPSAVFGRAAKGRKERPTLKNPSRSLETTGKVLESCSAQ